MRSNPEIPPLKAVWIFEDPRKTYKSKICCFSGPTELSRQNFLFAGANIISLTQITNKIF